MRAANLRLDALQITSIGRSTAHCFRRLDSRTAASTQVLEYYSSSELLESFFATRVLVDFYSGCKFPFPVTVFLQSVDELLEFMQTWGFVISFATCQPGNRSEYCPFGAPGMLTHQFTTPFLVIGSLY